MAVLHFDYRMKLMYEKYIGRCYFTIKCIPRDNTRQHLLGMDISLQPETTWCFGKDSFGNRQIYGSETEAHNRFEFRITGDVEVFQEKWEKEPEEKTWGIFRYPYGKCVPGPALSEYYRALDFEKCKGDYDICMQMMHRLFYDFSYVQGATNVYTGAEEAWALRKGVCQDYAHIYITLLRMTGISARYVCGLMIGEGESHAWVEALCDGRWIAFDPTNNCLVSDYYIKLGHGRDASDCAINRGLMWNGGSQSQEISALVEKKERKN